MTHELCIIHANCQGDLLRYLLECSPEFSRHFTIEKFTNFKREAIPPELFARCRLFLYQGLDSSWGELASEQLLAQLPPQAQALRIPNMFFNGYWPLWTNKTSTSYGDMLLEHLCAQELEPAAILHIYMKGNLAAKYDLDALVAASQAYETAKEEGLLIPTLPLVQEYWREEQLFYTINHPGPRLLLHVADSILKLLGLPEIPPTARQTVHARQEPFILPIHPQVGAHFGLPFASADRLYPVYGQKLTHAQYSAAYVAFKRHPAENIGDFIDFLQIFAAESQQKA